MRQDIEKNFFFFFCSATRNVRANGVQAMIDQKLKIAENTKAAGTTRCVWPSSLKNSDSRYLSRRVWMS